MSFYNDLQLRSFPKCEKQNSFLFLNRYFRFDICLAISHENKPLFNFIFIYCLMLYHLKLFYMRVSLIIMASFKANIISSNSIPKKHCFQHIAFYGNFSNPYFYVFLKVSPCKTLRKRECFILTPYLLEYSVVVALCKVLSFRNYKKRHKFSLLRHDTFKWGNLKWAFWLLIVTNRLFQVLWRYHSCYYEQFVFARFVREICSLCAE